jgi:hypothetical protein
MYKKNIDDDRKALGIKLSYILGQDHFQIENFDERIKTLMTKFSDNENAPIKSEYSYNLAYIPKYESLVYSDYLKN